MFDETIEALSAALRGVEGLRVDSSGLGSADPPAVALGPPTVTWDGYYNEPVDVSFDLALYVRADDRAIRRLLDLLPLVRAAIESVPDCAVTTATPTTFTAGATPLPAYLLHIEVTR